MRPWAKDLCLALMQYISGLLPFIYRFTPKSDVRSKGRGYPDEDRVLERSLFSLSFPLS